MTTKYTKNAILSSKRYRAALDALTVLLDEEKEYSLKEVDKVLAEFGKRPVTNTIIGEA